MALRLLQKVAGDDAAQAVQLGIEYDPQPPCDAGSPKKAPEPILALVRSVFEQGSRGANAARGAA